MGRLEKREGGRIKRDEAQRYLAPLQSQVRAAQTWRTPWLHVGVLASSFRTLPDRCTGLKATVTYTPPPPTPFKPVQRPQPGAIKSQSGFPAFTRLSTRALASALGLRPGASADQVYKPIAPGWVRCTGFKPPGGQGVYSKWPSTRCKPPAHRPRLHPFFIHDP